VIDCSPFSHQAPLPFHSRPWPHPPHHPARRWPLRCSTDGGASHGLYPSTAATTRRGSPNRPAQCGTLVLQFLRSGPSVTIVQPSQQKGLPGDPCDTHTPAAMPVPCQYSTVCPSPAAASARHHPLCPRRLCPRLSAVDLFHFRLLLSAASLTATHSSSGAHVLSYRLNIVSASSIVAWSYHAL
jgi:hypothetical protein